MPNWSYNAVDKTWHFQIDYAALGDGVDKISVRDMNRKLEAGTDGAQLHVENYIRVVSKPADAKIYFATGYGMSLFTLDRTKPGNVFTWNESRLMKIAGLGKDNVYVCGELQGTGHCNVESNWVRAEQKNFSWIDAQGYLYGSAFDVAGGGTYTYYAKSKDLNVAAEPGTITIKDKQIVCAMRSSTPVFGPCSDPESTSACSQSNVGYTVQGTGSCKSLLTCRCD